MGTTKFVFWGGLSQNWRPKFWQGSRHVLECWAEEPKLLHWGKPAEQEGNVAPNWSPKKGKEECETSDRKIESHTLSLCGLRGLRAWTWLQKDQPGHHRRCCPPRESETSHIKACSKGESKGLEQTCTRSKYPRIPTSNKPCSVPKENPLPKQAPSSNQRIAFKSQGKYRWTTAEPNPKHASSNIPESSETN